VADASGAAARSKPPTRDRLRAATASVALLVAVFVAGAAVQTVAAPAALVQTAVQTAAPAAAERSPAVADTASATVGMACAPVPPRTQRVHLMGKRVPVTDSGSAVTPHAFLAVRLPELRAMGTAAQVPLGSHVLAGHQGRAPPL
jgi:hypothetical protein